MRINLIPKKNAEIVAIVKLKRCVANTCILYTVIYKSCHVHKFCLVILLSIHKTLEIDFHDAVLPLSLAICL